MYLQYLPFIVVLNSMLNIHSQVSMGQDSLESVAHNFIFKGGCERA